MGLVDVIISYTFIKDMSTPFDKTKAFKVGIIDKDGNFLVKNKKMTSEQRKNYPNKLTILAWNIKKLLSKVGIGKSTLASFASALFLLKEEMEKNGMDYSSAKNTIMDSLKNDIFHGDREKMINEAFECSLIPSFLEVGKYKIFDETIELTEDITPSSYNMGIPLYETRNKNGKKIVFSEKETVKVDFLWEKNKSFKEQVPANNVGSGMIKGIAPGEDPPIRVKKKKKIYELMGRYVVFEVSPEEFEKCTSSKKKFEKWNKYFDEDSESGNTIKKYSYHNPDKGIILRNSETGQTMMFRRRWDDQRLSHNRKEKLLTQSKNKAHFTWSR